MEIDVDDYLSEEDKKRMVVDAYSYAINRRVESDFERILNNTAYNLVRSMVDDALGKDSKEIIKEKVIEVINKLSSHTVFNGPDAWDKTTSKGYDLLQESVKESAPLIESKVKSVIEELSDYKIRVLIKDVVGEMIDEKLFGKDEE